MQNVNCDKAYAYLQALIPHFPEGSVQMGYNGDQHALHLIIDAEMFAKGRTGTCYSIPVTCKYRKIRGMRTIVWVIDWIDIPVPFENKTTSDKHGTNIEKLKLLHKRAIEFHKENSEKVKLMDRHRALIRKFFINKFSNKYVQKEITSIGITEGVGHYTLELSGQNIYPDMTFNVVISGNKLTAQLTRIATAQYLPKSEIADEIKECELKMKNEIKDVVNRYRDLIFEKINPFK